MEELDRLLWHTGHRATPELLAALSASGLTERRGSGPQARIGLTDAGRRALIELGTAEIRALKRALRAINSETDPGAPPPKP